MTASYDTQPISQDDRNVSEQYTSALFTEEEAKALLEETLREADSSAAAPYVFDNPLRSVAVIGAGPAGLAAAKALDCHGLDVTVFDYQSAVGGVWTYNQEPCPKLPMPHDFDKDPSGDHNNFKYTGVVDATPQILQDLKRWHAPPSPCYRDLYNNTGTSLMEFDDFPWPKDTPLLCPQTTIRQYFTDYAKKFNLMPKMQLNTRVEHLSRDPRNEQGRWTLSLCKAEHIEDKVHITRKQQSFDAVVVATGLFNDPHIPSFQDLEAFDAAWPQKCLHSKQFRCPEDYAGEHVLLVGSYVSASDIAGLLHGEARAVTMAIRGPMPSPFSIINTIRSAIPDSTRIVPNIARFSDGNGNVNGSILLEDGTVLDDVDRVIFCTGYRCRMPFLGDLCHQDNSANAVDTDGAKGLVHSNGHRVLNTYRDIFLVPDPTLAFAALTSNQASTGYFYYQAQAIARVWSNNAMLPDKTSMEKWVKNRVPPFRPEDYAYAGERLLIQELVLWLNHHAKLLQQRDGRQLPMIRGKREELDKIWEDAVARWRQDMFLIINATKEARGQAITLPV